MAPGTTMPTNANDSPPGVAEEGHRDRTGTVSHPNDTMNHLGYPAAGPQDHPEPDEHPGRKPSPCENPKASHVAGNRGGVTAATNPIPKKRATAIRMEAEETLKGQIDWGEDSRSL